MKYYTNIIISTVALCILYFTVFPIQNISERGAWRVISGENIQLLTEDYIITKILSDGSVMHATYVRPFLISSDSVIKNDNTRHEVVKIHKKLYWPGNIEINDFHFREAESVIDIQLKSLKLHITGSLTKNIAQQVDAPESPSAAR